MPSRWGVEPSASGVNTPASLLIAAKGLAARAVFGLGIATASVAGCGAESDKQTYEPVALGMTSDDPPLYDGETQIFEVKRAVSLPITVPSEADLALLSPVVPPYTRTPWITKKDVKVQVSWTISNLDKQAHNIEILLDPWNEFARYVPGVNVGEEETVPDLSGIDLLMRIEGMSRKKGIFTFDDMDEVATDLATVENIIGATAGTMTEGVNGLVNHAFEIHNRSGDNDRLIKAYFPATIAGLVGFDIGLRAFEQSNVAIEIIVEITDFAGNRVSTEAPLNLDGAMWITPAATLTAPMGDVR